MPRCLDNLLHATALGLLISSFTIPAPGVEPGGRWSVEVTKPGTPVTGATAQPMDLSEGGRESTLAHPRKEVRSAGLPQDSTQYPTAVAREDTPGVEPGGAWELGVHTGSDTTASGQAQSPSKQTASPSPLGAAGTVRGGALPQLRKGASNE
jgi:hypothetical protein